MKPLILVVSSDQETIRIVNRVLEQDYSLLVAQTTVEATPLYERHLMEIQLVILDTALTDKLAPNWLKEINASSTPPYTILVASDTVPSWMIDSMKAGAMDIVRKQPLYEQELILAVKQAFDYKNLTLYLTRSREQAKNQAIRKRLEAFLDLLDARRAQGLAVSPNEIALYFPSQELEPELPLEKIFEAIESDETYALIKKWKSRPCLLIVEDEEPIQNILHSEFGREFEVIVASSCEDALSKVSQKNELDMAILDVGLPGMSGDDFVPILKKTFPKIQVLMLTGYSEYRLIVKTINSGAGDYVVKPFQARILRNRVFGLLQTSILYRVLGAYMKADG